MNVIQLPNAKAPPRRKIAPCPAPPFGSPFALGPGYYMTFDLDPYRGEDVRKYQAVVGEWDEAPIGERQTPKGEVAVPVLQLLAECCMFMRFWLGQNITLSGSKSVRFVNPFFTNEFGCLQLLIHKVTGPKDTGAPFCQVEVGMKATTGPLCLIAGIMTIKAPHIEHGRS